MSEHTAEVILIITLILAAVLVLMAVIDMASAYRARRTE